MRTTLRDGLYRVVTPYLCAGFAVVGSKVVACAPVLRKRLAYWITIAERVPVPVKRIDSFSGEYKWLSNFFPAPVRLDDVVYPTVEHAYQAAKCAHVGARVYIAEALTPGLAKQRGREITLRADWEQVKLAVMEDLLRQKFAVEPLKSWLAETGDAELVEGNHWGDTFWGVYKGQGQNHLGQLLMKIRGRRRPATGLLAALG